MRKLLEETMEDIAIKAGGVDVSVDVVACVRKGGYGPDDVGVHVGEVEDEYDVLMLRDRSVTPEEGTRMDALDFGTAVVAVAKNRFGDYGTVELAFVREYGRFLDLVGAMARETHASAVVSLDAGPGMLDLTGTADEIAANVHAARSDVTGLCDAVLVVCPGEEEPYDPDDIGVPLTHRESHPVCHVLKSATGAPCVAVPVDFPCAMRPGRRGSLGRNAGGAGRWAAAHPR